MRKRKTVFSKVPKIQKDLVSVTVFGPGFGESIVIYIPYLGWGIIDSCLHKVKGSTINPALEYLKSENVTHLSFLILTHPHKDHFQGFNLIIDHFLGQIDRICYYSGDGIREYRTFLAKKHILGEPGLVSLANIFKKFAQAKKAGAHILNISERTEIVRRNMYGDQEIEIIALSPSEDSIKKYVQLLHKAILLKNGDFPSEIKDREHNLLSSAILCKIGELSLIFGSDLEIGDNKYMGWKGVMRNPDSLDLAAHFVKVPHHGSENAFYEPIWKEFSKNNFPVSVITPYDRESDPLPRIKIIRKIANFSNTIAITAKTKTVSPNKIYDGKIVRNLHGVRSWRYLVKPDQIGCVKLSLSPSNGNVANIDLIKPAYIWSQ